MTTTSFATSLIRGGGTCRQINYTSCNFPATLVETQRTAMSPLLFAISVFILALLFYVAVLLFALLVHMFYYDNTFEHYYDLASAYYYVALYYVQINRAVDQYLAYYEHLATVWREPPPLSAWDVATRHLRSALVPTVVIVFCGCGYYYYSTHIADVADTTTTAAAVAKDHLSK